MIAASRRDFLKSSSLAAISTVSIVPRHVLGGPGQNAPSNRLNIAAIGAGGMGAGNIGELGKTENIVALCDVDRIQSAVTFSSFSRAKPYKDFREMLVAHHDEIDAVVVSTPDHTHAVAAMMALKMGKHVYCEKPLTHTLHEARELARVAKAQGVATQMGNGGHANEGARLTNEWIWAGVIGEVREVHVWTDRPGGAWKQGIPRPDEAPPVPESIEWDLWLGPAPVRDYHPVYLPATWRGWWDFGTGAIGHMGCHIIDHPMWALELGHPTTIQAIATQAGSQLPDGTPNHETYPQACIIRYEFPARGDKPPVTMTWYDGGLMPPKPAEMEEEHNLPGNGVLYIGSQGKMFHGSHGGEPQLIPLSRMDHFEPPAKTMERSIGHHAEWIAACKGGKNSLTDFAYSGPLTEVVLLGNIALRAGGQRLRWDGDNMTILNRPDLDQYLHREYRKGWYL
jgi:predicted dehydrogenase